MSETADEDLPAALLVDDEKEVADAYALRLRGLCDIETVYDGQTALEQIETGEIDILLLDRHMPGMSGDEVLDRLADTDFAGRVIMVTAIDPGFDVLDMPFDDYLCKPVDREDIRDAVSQQCTVLGYETLGKYFSAASTRSVIETELPEEKRADHDEYQAVVDRTEHLRQRATRLLDDADDLFDTFEGIEREGR
jgi:CheY-like chemotaxis protein